MEADLGIFDIACTYENSKVGHCPPAISWEPFYWWTRYPQEKGLKSTFSKLDKNVFYMTIVSLPIIYTFLKLFTYVGSGLGFSTTLQEIPFLPFQ